VGGGVGEQMLVSILRQGSYLIASIHQALNDREIVAFHHDLVAQIGTHRARGIIIDVAALDVLDSFGSRTLVQLAQAARLRGAETVIVGIQPTVAFAMVRLGLALDQVHTALDLQDGLTDLQRLLHQPPHPRLPAVPWPSSR
jgi:rsbT antagonist protein RsbS